MRPRVARNGATIAAGAEGFQNPLRHGVQSPQALFAAQRRERRLRLAIVTGCACSLALSPHLWVGTRLYPLSPLFGFLGRIPSPLDIALYLSLFGLLLVIAVVRRPAMAIGLFAAIMCTMAVFDQSRWTPWLYQYLIMLGVVGVSHVAPDQDVDFTAAFNTCRVIVVCVYFWSGMQKLGTDFSVRVFPWIVKPIGHFLPDWAITRMNMVGFIVPFVEISIAFGLLIPCVRRLAIYLGIAMHAFILLVIGPLGMRYNSVVWPWNVAMVLLLLLLFWAEPTLSAREILWPRGVGLRAVAILLIGICPAFSFFDLWDQELSFALYCTPRNDAELYLSNSLADRLPRPILEHVYLTKQPGTNRLNIAEWSLGEMNVGNYPEPRIYKNIAKSLSVVAATCPLMTRMKMPKLQSQAKRPVPLPERA